MVRLSRSHNGIPARSRAAAVVVVTVLALLPSAAGSRSGAAAPVTVSPAPRPAAGAPAATRARFLMGTNLRIEIPGDVDESAFEAAFAEVARLEDVLSNWRGTSEVSRLNRNGSALFRCSTDLFDALEVALHWAAQTDGAFDPTVEPLVRSLGLREGEGTLPGDGGATVADRGAPPPSPDRRGEGPIAAGLVGWRRVHLDPEGRTARFDDPGAGIDFGGIGKGIALDAAARRLTEHGVAAALLDFGGQVQALGAPPGEAAWAVGVADPADRGSPVARLQIRDASAATSGNSERGAGASGGHILDPSAGRPARFGGSVTVVASNGTTADALSTALFVMGPEAGVRWAEGRGVAVLYLWRGPGGVLERRATPAFVRFAVATSDEKRAAGRMEHRHAPRGTRPSPRPNTDDGGSP